MLRSLLLAWLVLCASLASSQTVSRNDVDIAAPDGTKLRATFFSAGKPGPGVLLLHMCNTTRQSWEPVAVGLSLAGIHALTIDNRGFGESGGPRFDLASPEVFKELSGKWPGDFDAAYEFLSAQPGVDKARIAVGGGSCGVDNAIKLAERHPDVRALVLLAGSTDVKGFNFIEQHPEIPIFTAAAADDEFNAATVQLMHWLRELSNNPHSENASFAHGRHGTEIFGVHPELVQKIVSFFVKILITSAAKSDTPVSSPKTAVSTFWELANQKGGAARAANLLHKTTRSKTGAPLFAELPVNLLGYDRLQAGDTEDAIELFRLNTEAYPASANAEDSLSDGYLAAGKNDLGLAAEEKCLQLLPNDASNADFKTQLEKQAREKIAKLKGDQK
jgi:dienelactone hydrolase